MCAMVECVVVAILCNVATLARGDADLAEAPPTDGANGTWGAREPNELLRRFARLYPVEEWTRAGYFTVEYLRIVSPHWLKFEPRPREQHYALAMIYAAIMFLGVAGNFLVIYLFSRCKALRTPANILVVNLACSDLLMMLKMPIFIFNSVHLGPALGDKMCRLYGFVGGLSGTCSICTITAISLDRYYVVTYPLRNRFSSQRAKLCATVSWLYAGSFAIVPLLDVGCGRYVPEGFLTSCSFDYLAEDASTRAFIWLFGVAAFVVPVALIVYFYASILRVVVRDRPDPDRGRSSAARDSRRHVRIEDRRRQELRVTAIVFSVVVVWMLAWTPYAVVALLGACGKGDIIDPLASMIPALFCKSASCCDPFIYALIHPKFKAELRKLCCGKRRVRRTFTARSNYESTFVESTSTPLKGLSQAGSKTRYWWSKPGLHVARSFSQRRNSSITVDKPRVAEDGIEELTLRNFQEKVEYI